MSTPEDQQVIVISDDSPKLEREDVEEDGALDSEQDDPTG